MFSLDCLLRGILALLWPLERFNLHGLSHRLTHFRVSACRWSLLLFGVVSVVYCNMTRPPKRFNLRDFSNGLSHIRLRVVVVIITFGRCLSLTM